MNFAQEQRNPGRHLVGIGAVVLLHLVIVYALLTGLARKIVDVVKAPLEVKVIEEVVKKPPPPELPPPPPKLAAPPPPFIPPPEITVAPPPVPAPTITAVTQEAPPAPETIAPVAAPPAPAPAAPAPPPMASVGVVCPNHGQMLVAAIKYPREAQMEGITGQVVLELLVGTDGRVKEAKITQSSNRIFNRAAVSAAGQIVCQAQAREQRVTLPIDFTLK
jgi:protein TonB